ncbi:MAG: PD40 domain-containing protein, partial [Actinobacteria bacterium]|nr:PD40 domain-containing protein [Actinomycetota bacterium]
PVFSADGTHVAYRSGATNLHPLDTDSTFDIYVKHLATGEMYLASTSTPDPETGEVVKGNTSSYNPYLSADGTRIAFRSYSTNLHPDDSDFLSDVYVKDLNTGETRLASTSDGNGPNDGEKGNGPSGNPALSADGTKVAFYSSATNLDPGDTDTANDVYVKDLDTLDIQLVSTSDTGVKGNGGSSLPYMSADGTLVAFRSNATNLDPGDTDQTFDIYVKNLVTGDLALVSTTETGIKGDGDSASPYISADGASVAFSSRATNLDPADPDSLEDLYVKDLAGGDLTLLSVSDSGIKGDGDSLNPALSADGGTVAYYSSATNLHPGDPDVIPDVYLKEIARGADMAVSISDSPDPVLVGAPLTYTIDARNEGPASATVVTMVDTLPSGVTFLSAEASQGSCTEAQGTVTCDLGGMAIGDSVQVIITVKPDDPGTIVNSVGVDAWEPDPAPANDDAASTTTVEPAADLAVSVVDSQDPVEVNEEFTYFVTVVNEGDLAATSVMLHQSLSKGLRVVTVTPSQGTCPARPSRFFACSLGTVPSGGAATITIDVLPVRVGTVSVGSTASTVEPEADLADNSDLETTTVQLP